MKAEFPGYFAPTSSELRNLWNKALFALDANVLLHVYRYSDKVRKEFLELLRSIADRMWIPRQAAFEFHRNRLNVILEQRKKYETLEGGLQQSFELISSEKRHPLIASELREQLSELWQKLKKDLSGRAKDLTKLLEDDPIREELCEITGKVVGPQYKPDELNKIYKDGETRYQSRIPPGYKDGNKPFPDKYGDLVMWKQLLLKSKTDKVSMLFLTDEEKEDWWQVVEKTPSPRPELVNEFRQETGQQFYMYSSARFMESANEFLRKKVPTTAINEVREATAPQTITFAKFDPSISPVGSVGGLLGITPGIGSSVRDAFAPLVGISADTRKALGELQGVFVPFQKTHEGIADALQLWRQAAAGLGTTLTFFGPTPLPLAPQGEKKSQPGTGTASSKEEEPPKSEDKQNPNANKQ